jgi:hypothetical protein
MVDLPTFGRPTRAITGTMRLSTALFQKIQKPLRGSGWCSGQHPEALQTLLMQGRLGINPKHSCYLMVRASSLPLLPYT